MVIDEIMEDILLCLLIYNVENKDRWMGKEILKLKIGCNEEEFDDAIQNLKEKDYIEFRNDDYLRITPDGIDYIIQKV